MTFACIYVATDPDGWIKVGMSNQPKVRVKQLTRQYRMPIQLVFATEIVGWAQFAEITAHWLLAASHIKGEWFLTTVDEAIDAVKEAVDLVVNKRHRPCERLANGYR